MLLIEFGVSVVLSLLVEMKVICLWVALVNPTLGTDDNLRHEEWVISGTLKRTWQTYGILFTMATNGQTQRGRHKSVISARWSAVGVGRGELVYTDPNDRPSASVMPLIDLRRSSCTSRWIFSTFYGTTLVTDLPGRLPSSRGLLPRLKPPCYYKNISYISLPLHLKFAEACSITLYQTLQILNAEFHVGSLFFFSLTKSQTKAYTCSRIGTFQNLWSKHNTVTQHTASWEWLLALIVHATVCCHLLVRYRTSTGISEIT